MHDQTGESRIVYAAKSKLGYGRMGRKKPIDTDIRECTIENLQTIVDDEIYLYSEQMGIEEKDISPRQWNDVLDTIQRHVFGKYKQLLKRNDGHERYDGEKVLEAYRVYKRICNRHNKTISLTGFEYFTGIEHQTLYNWDSTCTYRSGTNREYDLSSAPIDIRKIIMRDNEESLQALLESGRANPVGTLARLNRYHNWNVPGIRSEQDERKALPASQLPVLECDEK